MNTNPANFLLEQCEPRLLLSGYSLVELMGQAAPLTLSAPDQVELDGSISSSQPLMYQFTAQSTSQLQVVMSAGQKRPSIRLYNAKGHSVRAGKGVHGAKESLLSYQLEPGQTYYLKATTRSRSADAYSLGFNTSPVDDYGDIMQTAATVRLTRNIASVAGKMDSASDADMFKFVSTLTGTISIDTSRTRRMGIGPAISVQALDAAGQAMPMTTGGDGKLILNVASGQTYYLQVTGEAGGVGNYRLRLAGKAGKLPPAPLVDPAPEPASAPAPAAPGENDYAPGSSVTGQIVSAGTGRQLVVTGTDGNDSIVVTQNSNGISINVAGSAQSFSGVFDSLVIYGFAGDDTIRLTNSVSTGAVIYGGDGNDSLFNAGAGNDLIYGGAGDDLIVSVGGGSERIYGGAGLDSIWMDSGDTYADAESAENAVAAVHKISSFYQPFSTIASSPDYVPMSIAGQILRDPALYSYASGYLNFASRPLFAGQPSYSDIAQGNVGDCYYLASLASLAQTDPDKVEQMIAPLGDGTFVVRFYRNGQPVYLRLDADLPVSGQSLAYAGLGKSGTLWGPLMEKAYAFFRYNQNSYASINSGWMSSVNYALLNVSSTEQWSGSAGEWYNWIKTQLDGGHAVTLASKATASGPVWGNHAYMVKSAFSDATGQYVVLYNPWGMDGKSWDSNPSDGLMVAPVSLIAANFAGGSACRA